MCASSPRCFDACFAKSPEFGPISSRFPSRSNFCDFMNTCRPSNDKMSGNPTGICRISIFSCRLFPVSGFFSSMIFSESFWPVARSNRIIRNPPSKKMDRPATQYTCPSRTNTLPCTGHSDSNCSYAIVRRSIGAARYRHASCPAVFKQ